MIARGYPYFRKPPDVKMSETVQKNTSIFSPSHYELKTVPELVEEYAGNPGKKEKKILVPPRFPTDFPRNEVPPLPSHFEGPNAPTSKFVDQGQGHHPSAKKMRSFTYQNLKNMAFLRVSMGVL